MTQPTARPEDRRRGGVDRLDWADTLPACFRSEGFAEDLPRSSLLPVAAQRAAPTRQARAPRSAWLAPLRLLMAR